MKSSQPIGVFDSGVGGLTVARAVKKILPEEQIIYFGDTVHLPYGDKSTAAIQAYSVRIAEMLLQRKCKVILIACNSASSAAFELVTEYVGKRAKVFDVINPTVDFVRETYSGSRMGLIGTKQTVASGAYAKKINELGLAIDFKAMATPLLVPMIEEGFSNNQVSDGIIGNYLGAEDLAGIDSLILGCTHYPIIKEEIKKYYAETKREVEVIDSAEVVAKALEGFLSFSQLRSRIRQGEDQFFVSDFTKSFENATKIFFEEKVHLEKIPIWNEMN